MTDGIIQMLRFCVKVLSNVLKCINDSSKNNKRVKIHKKHILKRIVKVCKVTGIH